MPSSRTMDPPLSCDLCGEYAKNFKELETHRLIHFAEDRFTCPVCQKVFASTTNMRYHLATHTNEKRYQCGYCPKRFNWRSQLITHEHIHTGKGLYYCPLCSKPCMTKWLLTRHIKVHAKEGNVNIEEVLKGELKREPPPKANVESPVKRGVLENGEEAEGKARSAVDTQDISHWDSGNIPSYVDQYTPIARDGSPDNPLPKARDFHCTDCGKHFATQELMAAHLLEHLTGRHYECKNCGVTFSKLARLRKHSLERPECAQSNAGGYENFVPDADQILARNLHRARSTPGRPQLPETFAPTAPEGPSLERHTQMTSGNGPRTPTAQSVTSFSPGAIPTTQGIIHIQPNSPSFQCASPGTRGPSEATTDTNTPTDQKMPPMIHEQAGNPEYTVVNNTASCSTMSNHSPESLSSTSQEPSSGYTSGDPVPQDRSAQNTSTPISSDEDAELIIDEDTDEEICVDSPPKKPQLSEEVVIDASTATPSPNGHPALDLGKRKPTPTKGTRPKMPHLDKAIKGAMEIPYPLGNIPSGYDFSNAPLGFPFPVYPTSDSSPSALNLTTHGKHRRSSGLRGTKPIPVASPEVALPQSQSPPDGFNNQLLHAIDGQFSKMMMQMQLQHQQQMAQQSAQLGQLRAQLETHCEQSQTALSRMEQRIQGLEVVLATQNVPLVGKRENNIHNGQPGSK